MKPRRSQCLFAALLAAVLLTPVVRAEPEEEVPSPTVFPSPTPAPSPTPRIIPIALYFRKPAAIIPVRREEGEVSIPFGDFEIADETPWLTQADVRRINYPPGDSPDGIRLLLTREGALKYAEARMGNFGRTIILVIDGTARAFSPMNEVRVRERDQIDFYGTFSAGELERLQDQITWRPPPTPTPAPSPTPVKRERFIIR